MQKKQTFLYCKDEADVEWQKTFRCLDKDVHVYYFDIENLNPENADHVNEEERKKADRFLQKQDKLNFLYGRHLTRLLLGKYCNLPSEKIQIEAGVNKKPYAKIFDSNEPLPIKFNLSHSRSVLLIAFSQTHVGCDIEAIAETKYQDLLPGIFTENEAAFVINSVDSLKSFFKIWVCKEAVLKTAGTGLIDDLKLLEVSKAINVVIAPQLHSNENFFLTSFQINARFIAAVCTEANEQKDILFFNGAEF